MLKKHPTDTERLNCLEEWLRWKPGSHREIWSGAQGFECVEKSAAVTNPVQTLRAAIDAAMQTKESER